MQEEQICQNAPQSMNTEDAYIRTGDMIRRISAVWQWEALLGKEGLVCKIN